MGKYILELEDVPSMLEEGHAFYKCHNAPWWYISDMIISRLKQYEDKEPRTGEWREKEARMAIPIDYSNKWRLTQVDRDMIWEAIAAKHDVFALRPASGKAYRLQEITCQEVHALQSSDDFVFFSVWDISKEGAADERPEDC